MITIAFNSSALNTAMATIEKQLRFAAAKALTRTAKEAQAEVIRELPERFTLRTGWLAKGIRIVPATRDRLESTVLVKDAFMAQQETGGDKASPFGDSLGVPIVGGARLRRTSVTRPSQFPRALLAKTGYFIAPIAHGSNTHAVWKRTGKGRREKLRLMYVFKKSVRLKPRFGFHDTVRKVALERFPMRFAEALRQALATAR